MYISHSSFELYLFVDFFPRRYVSDLIKPPYVAASIKPTDCGEDFLSLSNSMGGNGQFIAWLSNSKTLVVLNSCEASVELFLQQKEWEITTIHPILEASHSSHLLRGKTTMNSY